MLHDISINLAQLPTQIAINLVHLSIELPNDQNNAQNHAQNHAQHDAQIQCQTPCLKHHDNTMTMQWSGDVGEVQY